MKARNVKSGSSTQPLIVACAQVWKEGGRSRTSRGNRGPQYVHDDEVLRVSLRVGSASGCGGGVLG
jgi:hypothetical protein